MYKFTCDNCGKYFKVMKKFETLEVKCCPFCRNSNVKPDFDIVPIFLENENLKLNKQIKDGYKITDDEMEW